MMRTPPLHHVGLIQPDELSCVELMSLLGLEEDYRGYVPEFHALCIFTKANAGSPLEFVVPDGGPLLKFNKGAGGMHHLAFEVPDLAACMRGFEAQGLRMLKPEPAPNSNTAEMGKQPRTTLRGVPMSFSHASSTASSAA